jgi:hypothetical protein
MRGIAFALVALTFVATMPQPVAAQCYGPECDRRRPGPPAHYDERPNFHSNPVNNGQPNRSAPYDQRQSHQGQPYQGQPYQGQPYQGQPYQEQPYQRQPYQGHQYRSVPNAPPAYQRPAYQGQPRPPDGYADIPPGVAPRGREYRPAPPDVRIEPRIRVTKISRPTGNAVRQPQPAPKSRKVTRNASAPAGAGQVTISVAEYRDLQNQARELQRLLSERNGAPNGGSAFPDVRLPPAGNPAGR